jgi:hypothetical protein
MDLQHAMLDPIHGLFQRVRAFWVVPRFVEMMLRYTGRLPTRMSIAQGPALAGWCGRSLPLATWSRVVTRQLDLGRTGVMYHPTPSNCVRV